MITPTSRGSSLVGALLQQERDRPRGLAHLGVLLVVVGEAVQDQDRLALRRAVLQADDREPADGDVRIVRGELVQQRRACCSRRRDGRARALRGAISAEPRAAGLSSCEPAPQQLELLTEAELRDRAVGLGADPVVGIARRGLELVVPLLAQRRERLLVAGRGQLVGVSGRLARASSDRGGGRGPGPT